MRGDRSVGFLLTRAFVILVSLIVCSGLIETAMVLQQHRVVRALTTGVHPLRLANAQLRGVLTDAQRGLRGYSLTGDDEMLGVFEAAVADYALVSQSLRSLADKDEVPAVDEQLIRADTWFDLAELQSRAPPRSAEAVRYASEGRPLFQAFLAANRDFDADLAARTDELRSLSFRLGGATIVVLVALTVGAALLAAITAIITARRITVPLDDVVRVMAQRGQGKLDVRADAGSGPTEIRAVAAAVNAMADEGDRIRGAERDVARRRGLVRELGYRIRAHLSVLDAIDEAIRGLAEIMRADHVLVRMAPGCPEVPRLSSLRDEHAGGPLAPLAGCDVGWLRSGDVWTTDDPVPAGGVHPPEAERQAWARVGDGPVLTVAVSAGEDCLGALTLIRDAREPFTPVDVRLTESVAGDLGRGVHLARLYEREQQLVARLQDLDTAKNDFLSTVSHELRTPLTSISGYVELLLDAEAGELTPQQARMLDVIGRNTRRLRELIEELLVLSKIESGTFQATPHPVDLAELVEAAVAAISPAAVKARVGLHTEVYGPLRLNADAGQLDRLLMNLLTNAVKFTPAAGTVSLVARREDGEVVIAVADTGMGIPEGEQDALFTRFFRASNAVREAVPGTGLGLAIVSTVVENHHGRIDVQSTEGVGTTFTIHLPVS
ncbi:ATP-binding protein [Actinoplanes sp. NPDC049118]|uniref:ATP-binding protein n=1 Tax=Actinoplanes sp. NPDC049118 TaxID=3155769 RepID=UPI0033C370E3